MPRAVIIGATGATGNEVLAQLLSKPDEWPRVTTIGRRPADSLPPGYPVTIQQAVDRGQLVQKTVDTDKLAGAVEDFRGHDVCFCAVGTTRAQAGSAAAFFRVDYHMVEDSAKAARAAGVPHYSLVTAQGANASVWASELGCFHGLFYMRTKGQAENAAIAQAFPRISVFRPGMLDRGTHVRSAEKVALTILSGLKVSDLARVMIDDAKRAAAGAAAGQQQQQQQPPAPAFFEDREIRRIAEALSTSA